MRAVVAVYVLVMLIFSASLRAESVSVPVEKVVVGDSSKTLLLSGYLPAGCFKNPEIAFHQDSRTRRLDLFVQAEKSGECTRAISRFDLVVFIEQVLPSSWSSRRPVAIHVDDFGFVLSVTPSENKTPVAFEKTEIEGKIIEINGEHFIEANTVFFSVHAPEIDLNSYAGKNVSVWGLALSHGVPIVDIASVEMNETGDEVSIGQHPPSIPLLLTGISEVL